MPKMVICFGNSSNDPLARKPHCVEIPEIPYWPLRIREFRRPPHPDPWWTLGEKAVDVAQDLQILSSLSDLASDLSPEFGRTVQAGIEQAANSMKEKLPKGVELHFREHREQTAE
jgi:hypothetical protein